MRALLSGVLIALAGCQPDVRPELEALQEQLAAQQAEIAALSAFVDAQAKVITVCEETIVGITDYLINTSTLGMLREAGAQLDNVGACTDTIAEFNALAAER